MGRTPCGPGMPVRSGKASGGAEGTLWDGAGAFVSPVSHQSQPELKRLAEANNLQHPHRIPTPTLQLEVWVQR